MEIFPVKRANLLKFIVTMEPFDFARFLHKLNTIQSMLREVVDITY